MASTLPIVEMPSAVSGICNREEITANFCYWMEEAVSIHIQESYKQCILQKIFSITQRKFHISLAVAASIVDVEILTSHLPN